MLKAIRIAAAFMLTGCVAAPPPAGHQSTAEADILAVMGVTSHCGVDVFSFVKIDGTWKVSNSMWTVEPEACAALRPATSSAIRPAE